MEDKESGLEGTREQKDRGTTQRQTKAAQKLARRRSKAHLKEGAGTADTVQRGPATNNSQGSISSRIGQLLAERDEAVETVERPRSGWRVAGGRRGRLGGGTDWQPRFVRQPPTGTHKPRKYSGERHTKQHWPGRRSSSQMNC